MKAKIDGYYYLHTNGDLIYKKAIVVDGDPAYFDGPFVKRFWPIILSDRSMAYQMLIDAEAMEAKLDRIQELKIKWKITEEDTQIFADRVGFKLFKDGNRWCATMPDFKNLQESLAGFGDTKWDALVNLCKETKK